MVCLALCKFVCGEEVFIYNPHQFLVLTQLQIEGSGARPARTQPTPKYRELMPQTPARYTIITLSQALTHSPHKKLLLLKSGACWPSQVGHTRSVAAPNTQGSIGALCPLGEPSAPSCAQHAREQLKLTAVLDIAQKELSPKPLHERNHIC